MTDYEAQYIGAYRGSELYSGRFGETALHIDASIYAKMCRTQPVFWRHDNKALWLQGEEARQHFRRFVRDILTP